jgi:hypothetical protein
VISSHFAGVVPAPAGAGRDAAGYPPSLVQATRIRFVAEAEFSSSKSRADHVGKSPQRGLRHIVAAGEVVSREQEHVLNAGFFAGLQEPLGTTLRRPEKPERIGDLTGLVLGDRRRIMRLRKLEACLRKPAKI